MGMTREELRTLKDLKRILMDEIKEVNEKGKIESNEIHPLYEVMDVIKDIATICAMDEYGEDQRYEEPEYSYGRGYSARAYSPQYTYDSGMSGARRRDSMGRYSGDWGVPNSGISGYYSGTDMSKSDVADRIQMLINSPDISEKTRMALQDSLKTVNM